MLAIPRTTTALFDAVHAELAVKVLSKTFAAFGTFGIFAVGFDKLFASIAAFIAF